MLADRHTCEAGFMVTRQPVFDRRLQPWGAAMCFAQPQSEGELFADETTANMLLEAYLPQRGVSQAQTIVSFPASAVLEGIPRVLWPQGIYVELEEATGTTLGIPKAVAELKQAGYGIAVSDFHNTPGCRALNALADVLVINADEPTGGASLEERIHDAHVFGAKSLVRGLTSWTPMLQARAVNADMFQGFFFNKMNLRPSQRSITATQLSRLRLLECLDKPDADFKALARIVEADAPLTYRLLLFLNSASLGLARQVNSIQQAIVLAGWKPLKKWLGIILLTDLSPTPRHQELCFYAAQRAGFLRRVAKAAAMEPLMPKLSLLGLLSYIEAIFEMPPAQALAGVPLEDDIRQALCGKQSSLSPWLSLVQAMENSDWAQAARLSNSVGLCLTDLSRCYIDSLAEADTLFRVLPAPEAAPAA
ncbi:MAG: HDOD domain-containing protein [Humidesulfovibrio sp.]|uniref:EAL and HDOD domain-containing protein n=1 Tax=Humidesulfovibrio sp. TaxID=2910988 RepID=UPI002736944A|nr:HDOD domain-containing protein [Humidesulfovibrio sp.]MDP2848954.1 HDOD domain-containing protein [Humidesulfovibrio sp.]